MAPRREWSPWRRARSDGPPTLLQLLHPLLIFFIATLASRCAARAPRPLPVPAPATHSAQAAAARYRGWIVSGRKRTAFRAQIFASRPDRLRIDVLTPLGVSRLSIVCREGKVLAVLPSERTYWSGEASRAGGPVFGLLEGAEFWVLAMTGDRKGLSDTPGASLASGSNAGRRASSDGEPGAGVAVLTKAYGDGSSLTVLLDEPGQPAARVDGEIRRDARALSFSLERQALLEAPGEEAFLQEAPAGFERLSGFDLLDMIAPDSAGAGGGSVPDSDGTGGSKGATGS